MLPALPRRVPVLVAAAVALAAGSLALAAPALADETTSPTLVAPAAGGSVAPYSPVDFTWTGPAGAQYVFEDSSAAAVNADGSFATADGGQQVLFDTTLTFPATGLEQTRYWHVGISDGTTVTWAAPRQVVFQNTAPDAGVGGVAVTATPTAAPVPAAPAPATSTSASPSASASAHAGSRTTAAASSAPAPSADATASSERTGSTPAASAGSGSAGSEPAARAASSRTAAMVDDSAAIPLALSGSLGAVMIALVLARLISHRRRTDS